MSFRKAVLIVLALFTVGAQSQSGDDVWVKALRATGYAAVSKAAAKPGCNPENPLSATPQYRQLCPKLASIPDSVIELAALPYFKRYLTEDLARQAMAFWSSNRGKDLTKKIVKEIETNVHNQLNVEDFKTLDSANKTDYGRALKLFASDREQGIVVARAMLAYVP